MLYQGESGGKKKLQKEQKITKVAASSDAATRIVL
jgi:hypothetical protein